MNRWSKIVAVLVGMFVPVVDVYADMIPVSEIGPAASAQICDRTDTKPGDVCCPLPGPSMIDVDCPCCPCLLEGGLGIQQAEASMEPVLLLNGEATSLRLCLYALMGLGLCRSAPFVTRFHFSCISGWHDRRGPSQVGPSCAISPRCLCAAPVVQFLQPDCEAEDGTAPYFSRAIAAVLRKSQFTPTTLAARGPPRVS